MSAVVVLAVLFLGSGFAKALSPGSTREAFIGLRVPAVFVRPWIIAAFPWLEIALGATLCVPMRGLRVAASVLALILMLVFLILVVRNRNTGEPCHCFGAASEKPITTWTIARNLVFVLLAGAAAIESLGSVDDRMWRTGVVVLALVGALLIGREFSPDTDAPRTFSETVPHPSASGIDAGNLGEDDEYIRQPIPDTVVEYRGQYFHLRDLAAAQALLLFRVGFECEPCIDVIDMLREHGPTIGPVGMRILTPTFRNDGNDSGRHGFGDEMVVRDPAGHSTQLLDIGATPAPVLLGTDGQTAGGPVVGTRAVLDFVDEVRQVLAENAEMLSAAQARAEVPE